jgi:ABC-type uncharacterized transport system auxiliary subunit
MNNLKGYKMTSRPARGAVKRAAALTSLSSFSPAPSCPARGSLAASAPRPAARSRPGWSAALAWTGLCFLGALALLGSGCGHPPMLVHQYLLEYPAPPLKGSPLPASLKVERFAVAQAYNTTSMIYQPGAFERQAYKYHRWRVNPGYLVADYLARDFRHAGLFQAVFSSEAGEKARFALEGGVEDFQEVDAPGGWQASLSLVVTLLDTEAEAAPRKVVFQKHYQASEPMVAQTPQGLAESMSRALERLSARIIPEVYNAAKQRLAAKQLK